VDEERLRKDQVSHFVLRLAYCRTEDLRRWLLAHECALFKHRLAQLGSKQLVTFMKQQGMTYSPTTEAEFAIVKDAVQTVLKVTHTEWQGMMSAGAGDFYSVPFEAVPDLVRGRRVYLRSGRAYVHVRLLTSLLVGEFRTALSKALVVTQRKWAARFAADEADRLAPLVESLATRYLGDEFGAGRGSDGGAGVSLAELDAVAAQSFPLCMRNLFGHLRDGHHLRHGGRMQLGLFLKGIGLSLEDALAFWRAEFCQKISGEQFDKQYAYGIRHNYGREGKRADYTPYSCLKVITSTPGAGEHHGCPYRTFSEDNLRAALRGMKLSAPAVADVLDKVRGKHHQLACGVAFAATHGGCECDTGVQHPNGYFEASRKLHASQRKDAPPALPAPPAAALPALPPQAQPAAALEGHVPSAVLALGEDAAAEIPPAA
jgi:DNA primase large subunit